MPTFTSSTLLSQLVYVILFLLGLGLLIYVVGWLLDMLEVPVKAKKIILGVIALIIVIVLLTALNIIHL